MNKTFAALASVIVICAGLFLVYNPSSSTNSNIIYGTTGELEKEAEEGYDGAAERMQWEFDRIKDPATGTVPYERLLDAIEYTKRAKSSISFRTQSIIWQERGPVYDSVGPSGNSRGGSGTPPGTYTAGRIRAVVVDAADASGNTVWCGGVAGGLWKCTNFLSSNPNWTPINDNFQNLAISSICQDPTNFNIMYFSTGEPTSNIDAVLGKGVWKSTDHGVTWNLLSSTASYTRIFKIACDASGNLYMAANGNGLRRSMDGGATFTSITPSGLSATCSDFEITSTGSLHAAFGYNISGGTANYRYTISPLTATTSSGWNSGAGFPTISNTAVRIELAALGNMVYAITTNNSNSVYAAWQSTDGGANWVRTNAADYTTGLSNTQGWYNITLAINPDNSSEVVMGGLDMYRSVDGGANIVKMTKWAGSTPPYLHADQHNTIWYTSGAESRMIVACDGGLFYSGNGGLTWSDRNKNLGLKQFYSCAIRPEAGSNYIIAGAQDNGVHRISTPGKTYSFEVTGGDGGFVDISQTNPNIQFGSYIYNQYRRSTNGGNSWSSVSFASNIGRFINPFDYDELSDAVYACYRTDTLLRWNNASASNTSTKIVLPGLATSTAVTASPYTLGTVYAGNSSGRVYKATDANTATNLTASSLIGTFSGNVSCINVGTDDNTLVAVISNYGVNNIWYTTNGGTTWTDIDDNLPDMPVRWAVFPPGVNNQLIIATEAGVYTSGNINGASTVWTPSPGFPTVRTDMLRVRASDNTIVAATHGRGIWSTSVLQVLPVRGLVLKGSVQANGQSLLNWTSTGAAPQTRFHIQFSKNGIDFTDVGEVAYSEKKYSHFMQVPSGFYRVVAEEQGIAPVVSNIVLLRKNNQKGLQLNLAPNPVNTNATMLVSGADNGTYRWEIITVAGQVLQRGNGSSQQNTTHSLPLNVAQLPTGTYWIRFVQGKNMATTSFIKQ